MVITKEEFIDEHGPGASVLLDGEDVTVALIRFDAEEGWAEVWEMSAGSPGAQADPMPKRKTGTVEVKVL